MTTPPSDEDDFRSDGAPLTQSGRNAVFLARMDERMKNIEKDVAAIKGIGKWFLGVVGGAILTAFAAWIMSGGLAGTVG